MTGTIKVLPNVGMTDENLKRWLLVYNNGKNSFNRWPVECFGYRHNLNAKQIKVLRKLNPHGVREDDLPNGVEWITE